MKKLEIIHHENEDNLIAYALYDFPWPISNRDIIIKTQIHMDRKSKNKVLLNISNTCHSQYPEKDKTIRIKNYHCMAILEAVDDNKTIVTYMINADPGGNLPSAAVNLVAKEAHYLTLKNLKKLVQKKKYNPDCLELTPNEQMNASIK